MAEGRSQQHRLRNWGLIQPEVIPLGMMHSPLTLSGTHMTSWNACVGQTNEGVPVRGAQRHHTHGTNMAAEIHHKP